MKRFTIILKAESEGEREVVSAAAECVEQKEGADFLFSGENCRYCVHIGDAVHIERTGDISYKLSLDTHRRTATTIRTPYGELPAEVAAERLRIRERDGSFFVSADYVLFFPNFSQKHSIFFMAKRDGVPPQ